jgi:hypothetical protein
MEQLLNIIPAAQRHGNGAAFRRLASYAVDEAKAEREADKWSRLVDRHKRRIEVNPNATRRPASRRVAMQSEDVTLSTLTPFAPPIKGGSLPDYVAAEDLDLSPDDVRRLYPHAVQLVGLDGRACWASVDIAGGPLE